MFPSGEFLNVSHRTALFAVLAIPAVAVEKDQVVDSASLKDLLNAVELRHRGSLSAHLDRIHHAHADYPLCLCRALPNSV